MSGVYSFNKLFVNFCWSTVDVLPDLETDVYSDDVVILSVYEDYEASLEEIWPDFIKDFYA